MRYHRRNFYDNEPRDITAKFDSICKCGRHITKGDEIRYYPKTRTAICGECAIPERQAFNEMRADETYLSVTL